MRIKRNKKKKNAFGLIETLIACAILIILIGALLSLNVIITRSILFSKQRSEAYYLAQGGIESVRQIRDTNLIDGNAETNWNSLICDNGSASTRDLSLTYVISSGSFPGCSPGIYRTFLIPETASNQETITFGGYDFQRKISFQISGLDPRILSDAGDDITEDNAIRVIVTVNWESSGISQQVELKEVLTNWKQGL